MINTLDVTKSGRHIECDQFAKFCHDIQSPIRNIANFLQLIKTQLTTGKMEGICEYVDFAIDNVDVLNKISKSLFKNDNNQNSKVDIQKAVKEIDNLFKNQVKGINYKINLDKKIPLVSGSYIDVFRVFKNLIENSLCHAKANVLAITIKTISKADANVSIIFEDNGRRLSLNKKNSIDCILNNSHNANERLGLTICRDLMNKLHGNIRIVKERPGCSYELVFKTFIEEDNARR
ncbi:MAG: hypothetical protein LBM19_03650 [Holosporales bacterium]|jgi:light-regulated signal transduction histidine kinase (bacteriophytochrome)|nr:hypothetical protein [Holosporales bacterium]